jgi:hypothetical protein
VRIFKTKVFAKFARLERIPDASRIEAGERARRGLIDADLGGGVIKQRAPRQGQGCSAGYRTLIASRFGDFVVFLFGFAKSERDDIGDEDLQLIARQWFSEPTKIDKDLAAGIREF